MNCQEVKQHLLDYEYGELEAEVSREVADALEGCPDCREELERLRMVREAFHEALPEQDVPHLVHADIMREARKAAARRQEEAEGGLLATLTGWLTHPSVAVAAAAMLVIVLSVVFVDNGEDDLAEPEGAPSMAASEAPPAPAGAEQAAPLGEGSASADGAPMVMAQRETDLDEGARGLGDELAMEEESIQAEKPAERQQLAKAEPRADNAPAAAPGRGLAEAEDDGVEVAAEAEPEELFAAKDADPASPAAEATPPAKAGAAGGKSGVKSNKVGLDNLFADNGNAEGKKAEAKAPTEEAEAKADKDAPADVWRVADAKQQADADDADGERPAPVHQSASNAVVARRDTRSSAKKYGGPKLDQNLSGVGSSSSSGKLSGAGGGSNSYSLGGSTPQGGVEVAAKDKADKSKADARTGEEGWNLKKAEEVYQAARKEEKQGNRAAAIANYNQVITNAPRGSRYHEEALYHRGVQQQKAGQHNAAIASYRQVLEQYPSGRWASWARYNLARTLLAKNPKDQEAERLLGDLSKGGGGGGVAGRAEQEYIRQFGKKGSYEKRNRAMRKKSDKKKRAKPKSRSYDFEAAEEAPAPKDIQSVE